MFKFYERIKRNKRKVIYAAGICGSGYAIYKVTRFIQSYADKYRINNNLNFKIQKAQYFQATLVNCIDTIKSILINIENEVELTIDSENIASNLGFHSKYKENGRQQYASLSADVKLDLWKKLKVLSFTKLTLLIYCWSFVCVTIHIQMSILAGNLFHSKNQCNDNSNLFLSYYKMIFPPSNNKSIDDNFQVDFINFTLKQIQCQMSRWIALIHKVSSRIVESISLKKMLTSDDILGLLVQIRDGVHNDLLEAFLTSVQIQKGSTLMESNICGLFTNVFESRGIAQINSLVNVFSRQISLSLDQKIRPNEIGGTSSDIEVVVTQAPLAKFVPFVWSFLLDDHNKFLLFNSMLDFSRDSHFRFMLFHAYENGMDVLNH